MTAFKHPLLLRSGLAFHRKSHRFSFYVSRKTVYDLIFLRFSRTFFFDLVHLPQNNDLSSWIRWVTEKREKCNQQTRISRWIWDNVLFFRSNENEKKKKTLFISILFFVPSVNKHTPNSGIMTISTLNENYLQQFKHKHEMGSIWWHLALFFSFFSLLVKHKNKHTHTSLYEAAITTTP